MKNWQSVPCKLWSGVKTRGGYGTLWDEEGRQWRVHRWAWTQENGEIPAGLNVCHHCDVPECYEVRHLWLGTQKENLADCIAKGRFRKSYGEKHSLAKLSTEQVLELREKYAAGGVTQAALARKYGVSAPQISRIVNRKQRNRECPPSRRRRLVLRSERATASSSKQSKRLSSR